LVFQTCLFFKKSKVNQSYFNLIGFVTTFNIVF
jgi:hypothetical protein